MAHGSKALPCWLFSAGATLQRHVKFTLLEDIKNDQQNLTFKTSDSSDTFFHNKNRLGST